MNVDLVAELKLIKGLEESKGKVPSFIRHWCGGRYCLEIGFPFGDALVVLCSIDGEEGEGDTVGIIHVP